MKLITQEIKSKAPAIGATEMLAADEVKIIAKFFNPAGAGSWYMTEYDPDTGIAFGAANIFELELGEFSIPELAAIKLPMGLSIERDLYFGEHTLADVLNGRAV